MRERGSVQMSLYVHSTVKMWHVSSDTDRNVDWRGLVGTAGRSLE